MMNHARCLLTKLLGWRWVLLTDFRGEHRIRRVRFAGSRAYAEWMGFGIRPVWLLDDGRLGNGRYVKRWEVADVCGERNWPTPPVKSET